MLWLIYASVFVVASSSKNLVHRFVLKTQSAAAYGMMENILSVFIFLPLLLLEPTFPADFTPWLLVLAGGVLWGSIALAKFNSIKLSHVSLVEPVTQLSLLVVFVLSVLLLGESVTAAKIAGTMLVFIGAVVVTYKKDKQFGHFSDKGVQFALLQALLSGVVALVDKKALDYFSPGTYGFFMYLLPGAFIACVMWQKGKIITEAKQLLKERGWYVVLVALLSPLVYYAMLKAYMLAEVSTVQPVLRLALVITVVGGMLIYKEERVDIAKKIIGTCIIIAGAILVVV